MTDLTIDQQRDLVRDAKLIVGTMGTNLLGLYFAPASCTVIGIIDDPAQDPLIAPTAAILGMDCQYFIAKSAGVSAKALHDRDTDFQVDCAAFRQRLREIEERAAS